MILRVGTFDVSGRKSLVKLMSGVGGSPAPGGDRDKVKSSDKVKVAVCTDVVVVAKVESGERLGFDSSTPRSAVVISAVGDKGIRFKGTHECVVWLTWPPSIALLG